MNSPSWMKPHLRQRLEQERKDAERTGPVNGEKALVADEKGRIKEVVTDHKPLPPKDLPPLPPKNGCASIGCKATDIEPPPKRFSWDELEKAFRPVKPDDFVCMGNSYYMSAAMESMLELRDLLVKELIKGLDQ